MLLQEILRLPKRMYWAARSALLLMVTSTPILSRQDLVDIRAKLAANKFNWDTLNMADPGRVSFAFPMARQQVNSDAFKAQSRIAVILAFGQSNIANEGDPHGHYIPGPGVYNFNFFDSNCYVAKCPLLGASMNRGNFVTRLGDLLVRRGFYDRVLLVPIGYGGTSMADWAPRGRINYRLMLTLELLRRAGIVITHAIFQQGESEGSQANPDGEAWARDFDLMINALRLYGMEAPIYVAQCTVCCCSPNEIIRAAQRSVVDPARGIFAGPDMDTIGVDDRWDGCHLSTTGLQKAAHLWFDVITQQQTTSTNRHEMSDHHASTAI